MLAFRACLLWSIGRDLRLPYRLHCPLLAHRDVRSVDQNADAVARGVGRLENEGGVALSDVDVNAQLAVPLR